jgi:sugar phosphate isomerase/epimerase
MSTGRVDEDGDETYPGISLERWRWAGRAGSSSSLVPVPEAVIERVGVQLYTVRDLAQQDFEGTLSRIGAIGFREVEFFDVEHAGYHGHAPAQVRAILDHAGLTAPSAHVGFGALETGWEATAQTARQVGHQFLVCAWIPEERRSTLDAWKHIGATLNRAGSVCKDAGIQFAYHNHDFEFATLEGKIPYDLLLETTDPALVKLELDLFWIIFAGKDPLAYFSRAPGRFPLVHVKDMRRKPAPDASAETVMADVGKGSIDWKGIFGQSRAAGIQHYFVEHDQPADPLASIRALTSETRFLRRAQRCAAGSADIR